jgi:hypothetical protein
VSYCTSSFSPLEENLFIELSKKVILKREEENWLAVGAHKTKCTHIFIKFLSKLFVVVPDNLSLIDICLELEKLLPSMDPTLKVLIITILPFSFSF